MGFLVGVDNPEPDSKTIPVYVETTEICKRVKIWINGIPQQCEPITNRYTFQVPVVIGRNTIQVTIKTKEPDGFFDQKYERIVKRNMELRLSKTNNIATLNGVMTLLGTWYQGNPIIYIPLSVIYQVGITRESHNVGGEIVDTLIKGDNIVTVSPDSIYHNNVLKFQRRDSNDDPYTVLYKGPYIALQALMYLNYTFHVENDILTVRWLEDK